MPRKRARLESLPTDELKQRLGFYEFHGVTYDELAVETEGAKIISARVSRAELKELRKSAIAAGYSGPSGLFRALVVAALKNDLLPREGKRWPRRKK